MPPLILHRSTTETEAATKDFIAMMKIKMQGKNLDDVLIVNQMRIYSHHANKIFDVKGEKAVQARSLRSDTKCVVHAIAISASGKKVGTISHVKGQWHSQIASH